MLQPVESNATPMYSSKKSSEFSREGSGIRSAAKVEREKNLQDRNRVNEDYKLNEISKTPYNNGKNTYQKHEEIRIIKPEEKDILTDLVGSGRRREKLATSPAPTKRIFKASSDIGLLKGAKATALDLKVADNPQDPNHYALFDQKNLRIRSSVHNPDARKPIEDPVNATPYNKKPFHTNSFKHSRTPNGREGRHSSAPKSPKESKLKQQMQNVGDMVVYSKSNSQEYPITSGRLPPRKPIQKPSINEQSLNNVIYLSKLDDSDSKFSYLGKKVGGRQKLFNI